MKGRPRHGPPGSSSNSFNEVPVLYNEGKCGPVRRPVRARGPTRTRIFLRRPSLPTPRRKRSIPRIRMTARSRSAVYRCSVCGDPGVSGRGLSRCTSCLAPRAISFAYLPVAAARCSSQLCGGCNARLPFRQQPLDLRAELAGQLAVAGDARMDFIQPVFAGTVGVRIGALERIARVDYVELG